MQSDNAPTSELDVHGQTCRNASLKVIAVMFCNPSDHNGKHARLPTPSFREYCRLCTHTYRAGSGAPVARAELLTDAIAHLDCWNADCGTVATASGGKMDLQILKSQDHLHDTSKYLAAYVYSSAESPMSTRAYCALRQPRCSQLTPPRPPNNRLKGCSQLYARLDTVVLPHKPARRSKR